MPDSQHRRINNVTDARRCLNAVADYMADEDEPPLCAADIREAVRLLDSADLLARLKALHPAIIRERRTWKNEHSKPNAAECDDDVHGKCDLCRLLAALDALIREAEGEERDALRGKGRRTVRK